MKSEFFWKMTCPHTKHIVRSIKDFLSWKKKEFAEKWLMTCHKFRAWYSLSKFQGVKGRHGIGFSYKHSIPQNRDAWFIAKVPGFWSSQTHIQTFCKLILSCFLPAPQSNKGNGTDLMNTHACVHVCVCMHNRRHIYILWHVMGQQCKFFVKSLKLFHQASCRLDENKSYPVYASMWTERNGGKSITKSAVTRSPGRRRTPPL